MTSHEKSSRRTQRALRRRRRKQTQIVVSIVVALAVIVGAVFLLDGDDGGGQTVLTVGLVEYGFQGDLVVPAGPVKLTATNLGLIPHNVGIRGGPISSDLRPGTSRDLDLGELSAGTYELYCDVADHEERGMVATLVVTAPATP